MQLGQQNEEDFDRIDFLASEQSTYSMWPTKEKHSRYKFNSFWIELNPSLTTIERQTYSSLDLVGDVGGLVDGLSLICSFLIAPIATYAMKVEILETAFISR